MGKGNDKALGAIEDDALMLLLDTYEVAPPSETTLDRVFQTIAADMEAPDRAKPSRLLIGVVPTAVLVSWVVLLTAHGQGWADPRLLWSGALALVSACAAMGAFKWKGLMAVGLAGLGVLAALFNHQGLGLGSSAAMVRCFAVALAAAALPLGLAALLTVTGRITIRSGSTFAGIGAAGAFAGLAALEIACGEAAMGHSLISHVGGVTLAALTGLALATIPPLRRALTN